MSFGETVRSTRMALDITLTELAKQVDISIAYLSRIERDQEKPPSDRLVNAIATALGLEPDQLFAAARRLPPDMRAQTGQVIAFYRRQTGRHGRTS